MNTDSMLFVMFSLILFLMVSFIGYLYLFKFNPKKLSPEDLKAKIYSDVEGTIFAVLSEIVKLSRKEETNREVARKLSNQVYQKLTSDSSPFMLRRAVKLITEEEFYNSYDHLFFKHVLSFRGPDPKV